MEPPIQKLPKLIVILGPTASGKTEWSLRIAKKINGEIISADSRQIYRKMDIGTAKVKGEWKRNGVRKTYFVDGIPHHLIDFLDPGKSFTAAEFRDKALKYAKLAYKNGRIPMIVGGTGLYIQSVVDNFTIPRVGPNKKLRKSLEEKSNVELFRLLKEIDPETADRIDAHNKRRLIRALEVCILTGEHFSKLRKKGDPLFDVLMIGPRVPKEVHLKRIDDRVEEMTREGLVQEIENLLKQKYSWDLPSMNGIGYRQMKDFFEKGESLEKAKEKLRRDTRKFAKRQMTWFKRDNRINWCDTYKEAEKLVEAFLAN